MRAAIYRGRLVHARRGVPEHRFTYPVYFYGLDVDALGALDRDLPLFGYNRIRPVALHDRDYFEPSGESIAAKVRRRWREAGVTAPVSRVLLVTQPRHFHYVFNPVSFYLGFDEAGVLICALAEVNNTFGDRHLYVMPRLEPGPRPGLATAVMDKVFHVSPFNDLGGCYRFSFDCGPERMDIGVDLERGGEVVFHARLEGRGVPMTTRTMLASMVRQPLTAVVTVPRIAAQAARLRFGKKLPVHTRPEPESPMTIIRRPPGLIERLAQRVVTRLLGQIRHGCLRLTLPGGEELVFGDPRTGPTQCLRVRRHTFFSRIMFHADVGLGEAYVEGDVDCDDPAALLELLIANRDALGDGNLIFAALSRVRHAVAHGLRMNTRRNSRRNIHAHYDLNNAFFATFLDASMTYSSARFLRESESLHSAQLNKLRSLIWKARIQPDHHVLEIGSGWGSFAIEAAMQTGCRVTTITVSEEQFKLARERVKAAGLEERVTVRLCDYRAIEGTYDRIVSIEMLEAVGHRYLPTFFRVCDEHLAKDGLVVLQVITIPDHRYDAYRKGCDWIQKHIFPGGLLPSLGAMTAAMRAGGTALNVEHLENLATDYAKTLSIWRQTFVAQREAVRALGFDETFIRKWIYYLAYSEAGFATRTLNTLQLVLTRPFNATLIPDRGVSAGVERPELSLDEVARAMQAEPAPKGG